MLKNQTNKTSFLGSIFYWLLKNIICRFASWFWLKKIVGLENIPKKDPFILAANHSSHLDFMLLISILDKRLFFFVKDKYYIEPCWNFFLIKMGHLKAANGSFRKALGILRNGKSIAIFPEGTRTRNGAMGKGHSGAVILSKTGNVPIIPVGIQGSFDIWPPQKKYPRFKKSASIYIGKPIYFPPQKEYDFTKHTDLLMDKIEKLKNSL